MIGWHQRSKYNPFLIPFPFRCFRERISLRRARLNGERDLKHSLPLRANSK